MLRCLYRGVPLGGSYHGPRLGLGNFLAFSLVLSSFARRMWRALGVAHLHGWNSGAVEEAGGNGSCKGQQSQSPKEPGHRKEKSGLNHVDTEEGKISL